MLLLSRIADIEALKTGLAKLGNENLGELKLSIEKNADEIAKLGMVTAKHTVTLNKQYEQLQGVEAFVETSDDRFGADFQGFGTAANRTFAEIDALFDALAARVDTAEKRADVAEANAAEERLKREAAERLAQKAADTAAKAAAAAEIAADAAGASKLKRQEAEKRARQLWNQVTAAEEGKKSAEQQLMVDLQAARADLWPAARKRAAEVRSDQHPPPSSSTARSLLC